VKALETILYSTLTGDETLMGYLPGGVHNTVVENPTGTYMVFQKVAAPPAGYTYRLLEGETYLYQFRIIAEGYSTAGSLDALARLRALLNLQELVVEGHAFWRMTWDGDLPNMVEMGDAGVPLLQVGATYRIELGA